MLNKVASNLEEKLSSPREMKAKWDQRIKRDEESGMPENTV